jgi:heptaprenyl diphosphate synthase
MMTYYRIPEMAHKYMDFDMIHKHTELPQFPEFRTRLLYEFLRRSSSFSGYSELYSLVTSLVQMALDTHDMVSITNQATEMKAARSRQLKVLAGDYFSIRFYYLLAHAGQIELIGTLSHAICEVNRLKMTVYQLMKQLKLSADEYIKLSVEVRTQLFLAFTGFMEGSLQQVYPEIIRLFTECELLLQEIGRSEKEQQLHDSWGFWYVMQYASKEERKHIQAEEADAGKLRSIWMKYKVTSQLYRMLDRSISQLQSLLQALDSKELGKELLLIGEPLIRYLSSPKALEEI